MPTPSAADSASIDWNARHAAGDTPWDMGQPSPPLLAFLNEGILPAGRRVLVPGCGRGFEVALLAHAGYAAVGVDLAPAAIAAARAVVGERAGAELLCLDFFASVEALMERRFDWVFDQTFFCAIPPVFRLDYARVLAAILRPGGEVWALSMRTDTTEGPPYDSLPEDYINLLSGVGFELVARRPLDAESHPARRGRETLVRMRRR